MPICSTIYRREDGTEARAQVVVGKVSRSHRSTLRDRIARLELDLIDRGLRAAFDDLGRKMDGRPQYVVGVDLSNTSDVWTIWEIKA